MNEREELPSQAASCQILFAGLTSISVLLLHDPLQQCIKILAQFL
jgi:hypothetical protein